jgi:hypothetical protein
MVLSCTSEIRARECRVTCSEDAAGGAAETSNRRLGRVKLLAVCRFRVAFLIAARVGIWAIARRRRRAVYERWRNNLR